MVGGGLLPSQRRTWRWQAGSSNSFANPKRESTSLAETNRNPLKFSSSRVLGKPGDWVSGEFARDLVSAGTGGTSSGLMMRRLASSGAALPFWSSDRRCPRCGVHHVVNCSLLPLPATLSGWPVQDRLLDRFALAPMTGLRATYMPTFFRSCPMYCANSSA